jgi:hypothetical protein
LKKIYENNRNSNSENYSKEGIIKIIREEIIRAPRFDKISDPLSRNHLREVDSCWPEMQIGSNDSFEDEYPPIGA